MTIFIERRGEKDGQRRRRFLEFLRALPKPSKRFDDKLKRWIPDDDEAAK